MKNKENIILLVLIVFLTTLFGISTLSKFKASSLGKKNISVANFKIKLNESLSQTQSIDLQSTITPNDYSDDYLMPGTNGTITLVLDFSEVDVSTNYTINLGTINLPNNLNLYSDSTYTTEFTPIDSTYNIKESPIHTYSIYWKWQYKTDEESNINDNIYMNKNLSIPIIVKADQKIGGGN